ncbi:MAG: 50S ribosomal protein L22 [Candidatus Scalindua sp. AMX11]|nr:MAG: 50S ribosomal protein L22 [Candidatus Scalindua sp.]NOG85492.1 50S ribosomal protein L22 [Planctomycetota bacterium]RZV90259.1 MAG: 50S ribosomal protein L22 [Candidatus Scalindua sp. SCAELEC01]TDE64670.1 MAG: 50S ribosomal protein L22 [Candidatus Scalindua sp. AMX11]GJQ57494.1 MAG: 50S ribosomal protein L22 [Candidatus Scalindua sp.]
MEFKSKYRFAKTSPRKARYVADLIRGKSVNGALGILRFTNKRASSMLDKILRAAIASVLENGEIEADSLFVKEIRVDEGPVRKWHRPRARGVSTMIKRRTSHISLVLTSAAK